MKKLVLLFFLPIAASGQQDSTFFFDQYTINLNQTMFSGNNPVGKIGFGCGVFHTFRKNKRFELPLGFEFNRTNYFQDLIIESKYNNLYNARFGMNAISVVLTPRISLGNKTKFIFEGGVYGDFYARSRQSAQVEYSNPYDSTYTTYHEEEYIHTAPKFGIQAATGILLPIKNKALIIKFDYKFFRFQQLNYFGHTIAGSNIRLTLGFKL